MLQQDRSGNPVPKLQTCSNRVQQIDCLIAVTTRALVEMCSTGLQKHFLGEIVIRWERFRLPSLPREFSFSLSLSLLTKVSILVAAHRIEKHANVVAA
jgi:hypothetical protein